MLGPESGLQSHKHSTRSKENHTLSAATKLHTSLELRFSFTLRIFSFREIRWEFLVLRTAPNPKQHPYNYSQFRKEHTGFICSIRLPWTSPLRLQTHKMAGKHVLGSKSSDSFMSSFPAPPCKFPLSLAPSRAYKGQPESPTSMILRNQREGGIAKWLSRCRLDVLLWTVA